MVTDSAAASIPPPQTRSFFDLAPETRNQIYQYVFKGQKVKIRKEDNMSKNERKRAHKTMKDAKEHAIVRDRAISLNILFTCNG